MMSNRLEVRFEDQSIELEPPKEFSIGRDADLVPDAANPYLHRRLLHLRWDGGVWWIENVGSSIPVALTGGNGTFRAWLGPGVRLPVVLPQIVAEFTAGAQRYELTIVADDPPYRDAAHAGSDRVGAATIGDQNLTPSQRMLILALAEPLLRQSGLGTAGIPTSAAAAARLRWPLTTFNRKLDNVCDKLDRLGVDGMRGGVGNLATNRKARLVEYAILSRTVTPDDLALLDALDISSQTLPPKD